NARLPLWFMEGMAEYLSIGRIDPHTVSWLRDAVLSGYMRNIAEMSRRDDYLSYRFGQSLWAYVGRKWGDEVIGIILQKAPRMGVERAFTSTLGLSLADLSNEWTNEVRKQYLPQIAEFQTPESFSKRVVKHDKMEDPWYLAPALSPDGSTLAILSQRSGYSFDLWLVDAVTGKFKKRLIDASKNANFESLRYMNSSAAFSPDGKQIAFAAQTSGYDALYIYDLGRGKVVRKLKFKLNGVANPSYAPDGKSIVFSGNDGGISDLFITTLDGELTRLTDDKYADLVPAWSPDGKSIAFTTDRGPQTSFETLKYGNFRVAVMDVETRKIEVLPNQDRGKNHNPVWSPDSKQMIWVNDETGTNNLYLYDIQSRSLSRLTDVLSGVIAIAPTSPVLSWSKSGRFAYNYFERAGYSIYTIEDPTKMVRGSITDPLVATSSLNEGRQTPDARRQTPDAVTRSFYRSAGVIRASAQTPATFERTPSMSITAMMDSTVSMPDTATFEMRDYKMKFTPDVVGRPTIGAQAGGFYGGGVYGGSYVALSDMLGNHNMLLAGNINGSFSDAEIVVGYASMKHRLNYSIVAQQSPQYRYYGGGYFDVPVGDQMETVNANVFQRDVIRQVQAMISYPFSTFRRVELGATAINYQSDIVYRGYFLRTQENLNRTEHLQRVKYAEPMAALVFDNSVFGWTGPINGRRYRFQVSKPMGDFALNEAMADFRNYANYKNAIVLATRFMGLTRGGRDSDRFLQYWGGPYFVRGYDATSFDLNGDECRNSSRTTTTPSISQCPVRDQLIGSSAAFLNAELRFPIIKELQIGFLGNFPPVDLVTFFDGGVAWNQKVCSDGTLFNPNACGQSQKVAVTWDRKAGQDPYLVREPLFSYGLGLRINIFYTILRLDYAMPVNRPDHGGVFSVSFGPSF
ncbi:MAG TPA: BamA/TamA family outer membrane protein, partial [Longimicrobiales bacterium]|nr:BamA/TamA family outer membrane protein [Longimicrobiales bacterium]